MMFAVESSFEQTFFLLKIKSVNKFITFYKVAFTLAEILITTAIIGVVATLTLPNLINNIRKDQYVAKLKKSVAILSNAARINKAMYEWDFSDINTSCNRNNGGKDNPESARTACALFNHTLKGSKFYLGLNSVKLPNGSTYKSTPFFSLNSSQNGWMHSIQGSYNIVPIYQLADGSILLLSTYLNGACSGKIETATQTNNISNGCYALIDVNGIKPPNKMTRCNDGGLQVVLGPKYPCKVDKNNINDIFVVGFHDSMVEPLSNATRYVFENY